MAGIEHFSVHRQPTVANLTRFTGSRLLASCQELTAASTDYGNQQEVKMKPHPLFFFPKIGKLMKKRKYEDKYFLWFETFGSQL